MKKADNDLDRLLRAAAQTEPAPPEAPYGFETRVIALWREGTGFGDDVVEVGRFLRTIGAVALAILGGPHRRRHHRRRDRQMVACRIFRRPNQSVMRHLEK